VSVIDRRALVANRSVRTRGTTKGQRCPRRSAAAAGDGARTRSCSGDDAHCGTHDVDDTFLLLHGDRRPQRHREVLLCDALGLPATSRAALPREAQGRLEVQWLDVIGGGADARVDEGLAMRSRAVERQTKRW